MEIKETIYDGESVKVYGTDNPDEVVFRYTDSITAYKKIKRAEIANKGRYCCAIADMLYNVLERAGIRTHYLSRLSEYEILCRKADVIPVEVIVRNVIAGSMSRRLGVPEGVRPSNTIFDLCYRHEELYDPLINDHHAVALGLATYDELKEIYNNCMLEQDETSKYLGIKNDIKVELEDGKFFMIQANLKDYCYYENEETNQKFTIKMPDGLLQIVNENINKNS